MTIEDTRIVNTKQKFIPIYSANQYNNINNKMNPLRDWSMGVWETGVWEQAYRELALHNPDQHKENPFYKTVKRKKQTQKKKQTKRRRK
jgi:hypothetical protein